MVKEIQLRNGGVTLVSEADYDRVVTACGWYLEKNGYARSSCLLGKPKQRVQLHRYILGVTDPKILVDHINGQKLDNRRENIRLCSNAENQHNRHKLNSTNTSGVSGVCWHTRDKIWTASVYAEGKHIHLGNFCHIDAAIAARKSAELKYFGAFASAAKLI